MNINYEGGTKFTAETRGHSITVDLPQAKGGTDQGMTPPELLVAAFGTCIGVYVTQYCQRVGMNCDDVKVSIEWETIEAPLRIGQMHAKVHIPAGIPEERRSAIRQVAENCLIHQTLCNQPEMSIEFT